MLTTTSKPLHCLLLIAALAGCATRADQVAPAPTPFEPLLRLSCEQLRGASDGVAQQAADRAYAVDAQFGNNLIALGLGVIAFWPALATMRGNAAEAAELAQLKGEYEALQSAAQHKGCPAGDPPELRLPDDGKHRGPVRAGDRYVYEEFDPVSGASLGRGEQRVRGVKPGRLELSSGVADAQLWTTDMAGNWRSGAPPQLRFIGFLRADLVPGQHLSGQLAAADEQAGMGRIEGRVTALETYTLQARQFEVARIELSGHVPSDSGPTQTLAAGNESVQGWLLVERRSGQVLQAQLRSRNPAFAWQRSLLRFERGG